jgi:hypothetical protein
MTPKPRKIKVQVAENGEIKFDNAGNPDEKRILRELGELAQLLTGDAGGFAVEAHVHTHLTAHVHADGTVHTHG